MSAPTNAPTRMDITINEMAENSKDIDNLPHQKTRAKKSYNEDCKQNNKNSARTKSITPRTTKL